MPPDGLEQPFGGKAVFVMQHIADTALVAPVGVKGFNGRVQWKLVCSGWLTKSIYFERNSGEACLFNDRLAEVFVRRSKVFSAKLAQDCFGSQT